MKLQGYGANSVTADSCFGLIGPCQCSAAVDGPAILIVIEDDLRHQGTLISYKCNCRSPETLVDFLNFHSYM